MHVRRACPPGWSGSSGWGCSCRTPAPAGGCRGCQPKTWSPWGRYLRRQGRGRTHTRVGGPAGWQERDKAAFMLKKGEEDRKLTCFSLQHSCSLLKLILIKHNQFSGRAKVPLDESSGFLSCDCTNWDCIMSNKAEEVQRWCHFLLFLGQTHLNGVQVISTSGPHVSL